jgi:hypothetical protein
VALFVRPGREIQLSPPPAKVLKGDLAKAAVGLIDRPSASQTDHVCLVGAYAPLPVPVRSSWPGLVQLSSSATRRCTKRNQRV